MIKTRLIKLLSHAKKYVVLQVVWQLISLVAQIALIFCLSNMISSAFNLFSGENTKHQFPSLFAAAIILCIAARFFMEWLTSRTSFRASADVKQILRAKIYEKLLKLGSSYRESVKTAEVVQLASEGVEQLEIYFGKYLSQPDLPADSFFSFIIRKSQSVGCPTRLRAADSSVNRLSDENRKTTFEQILGTLCRARRQFSGKFTGTYNAENLQSRQKKGFGNGR